MLTIEFIVNSVVHATVFSDVEKVYSLRKRNEIISIHGEVGKCVQMASILFNERSSIGNINLSYVLHLVRSSSKLGRSGITGE